MGGGPVLTDQDQLMLAPVEGAHAANFLVPDTEVLELGEDALRGRDAALPPR